MKRTIHDPPIALEVRDVPVEVMGEEGGKAVTFVDVNRDEAQVFMLPPQAVAELQRQLAGEEPAKASKIVVTGEMPPKGPPFGRRGS